MSAGKHTLDYVEERRCRCARCGRLGVHTDDWAGNILDGGNVVAYLDFDFRERHKLAILVTDRFDGPVCCVCSGEGNRIRRATGEGVRA